MREANSWHTPQPRLRSSIRPPSLRALDYLEVGLTLASVDGTERSATLFAHDEPRASIVISNAYGVPARFYGAFARELAGRGFAVLTHDYRGVGDDLARLRASRARMQDIPEHDLPEAISHMRTLYPQNPVILIGHSFGGHAVELMPGNDTVDGIVMVAAHAGYWWNERVRRNPFLRLWLGTAVPTIGRVLGYVPGKSVGFTWSIATTMWAQWARWIAMPGYFFDDPKLGAGERAARIVAPTLVIHVSDDEWASEAAMHRMVADFPHADVTQKIIVPSDFALPSIEHLGLFRPQNAATWPIIFDYVEAIATKSRA